MSDDIIIRLPHYTHNIHTFIQRIFMRMVRFLHTYGDILRRCEHLAAFHDL